MSRVNQILRNGLFFLLLAAVFAAGCQSRVEPEVELELPTAPAGLATAVVTQEEEAVPEAAPVETPPPSPTSPPAATVTPFPTPTAVPTVMALVDPVYEVAFVAADDTLNVRSGPGVDNDVIAELAPDARGIEVTGREQEVEGSTWVEISTAQVEGWVNSYFLTNSMDADQFCANDEVLALLDSFETVVANQNGDGLAQLVHPERGLQVHRYRWSPVVRFQDEALNTFFVDEEAYDWGVQDGSGLRIVGTVTEIIVPLFEQDIVNSTELRCNDVMDSEWMSLPEGYERLNSYSYYQPGTDEYAGLDWGQWVLGIDWWEGRPYISYLVHYQWEI